MRSRMNDVTSAEVCQWAIAWLIDAELLSCRGRVCTPTVVWSLVLRAATRMVSLFAACRDLADAPTSQAVFDALVSGLPKTLPVLERRLNDALTGQLPRRLRRRTWQVAIDWHLVPYYGEPCHSRNELYHSKPQAGTTTFHAYATACIVEHGQRYTVALTWIRKHETTVRVLGRLLDQIERIGLKIRYLLLDSAFYNIDVVLFLQQRKVPFLMPAVIRGRKPKRGKPPQGLRLLQRQGAGWHKHTLQRGKLQATVSICITYRTYRQRGQRKRQTQQLLFAAWRVSGTPVEIRQLYRHRFGIESSYRQRRQARIYTCTPDPRLRLVFVAVSLLLRNLWVWIHAKCLAKRTANGIELRLELLRFKRLLDWINLAIVATMHDGSMPYINDDG
jgi:Transposase DDE domain